MDRRSYLRAAGAAGALGAVAGCLETISGSGSGDSQTWGPYADETILDPPSEDRGRPIHPIHGDELPSFSLPDPLVGETITDEQFRGERAILMTFFYTECPDGVCPALLQRLRQAQHTASREGYEDEVAFLAVTFDPERDTAEALEAEAEAYGIDLEANNWHFLRPEDAEAAEEFVLGEDGFGLPIEREDGDHDHGGEGGDHGHDEENHDNDSDEETDHEHEEETNHDSDEDYTFTHFALILLANEDGIVERSYPRATRTSVAEIESDLSTVVEG